MISYLLGQLSETERKRLEEEYFNDNETFTQLLETEEQLINDYLHKHLRRHERKLFEQHYLTIPCKEKKVEFAQLLDRSEVRRSLLGKSPADRGFAPKLVSYLAVLNRPWVYGLAGAILLTSAVTALWLLKDSGSELHPLVRTIEPSGPSKEGKSINSPVVSLALSPRARNSDREIQPVLTALINAQTQFLELKLRVSGEASAQYRGRLKRIDQGPGEVAHEESLTPSSSRNEKLVVWRLSAARLATGQYQVELQNKGAAAETNLYDLKIQTH